MPRHSGSSGLAQLRQQGERDNIEQHERGPRWTWRATRVTFGSLAVCALRVVTHPLHVLQLRQILRQHSLTLPQSVASSYSLRSLRNTATELYHERGLSGFVQGYLASCVSVWVAFSTKSVVWSALRAVMEDKAGRMGNYWIALSMGMLSAATGAAAAFPFRLISTRMALLDLSSLSHGREPPSPESAQAYRSLFEDLTGGARYDLRALFVGVQPMICHQFVSDVALCFAYQGLWWLETRPVARKMGHLLNEDARRTIRECLGDCISKVICYPLLLVELKIETGMCEEFGEALMQTVDVVQKEGPSALYAGLVPYLLQVISQHLLYFALLKSFG